MQRGLSSPQALCAKRLGSAGARACGVAPLRFARRSSTLAVKPVLVRAEQATSAAPTEQQQQEAHSNGNGAASEQALGSTKHIADSPNDLEYDSVSARELAENGTLQKILSTTDASTQ